MGSWEEVNHIAYLICLNKLWDDVHICRVLEDELAMDVWKTKQVKQAEKKNKTIFQKGRHDSAWIIVYTNNKISSK